MEKNLKIEEEIDKTLRSVDSIEMIECTPLFYTKLMGRIESQEKSQEQSEFTFNIRDYLRPALLIIIVAVNLLTGIFIYKNSTEQISNRTEYIESLSKEFSIKQSNYTLTNLNNDQ